VCGCDCEGVNLDNGIADEIRCGSAGEMAALNAFYVWSARSKTFYSFKQNDIENPSTDRTVFPSVHG
jgi:hypothetical protein